MSDKMIKESSTKTRKFSPYFIQKHYGKTLAATAAISLLLGGALSLLSRTQAAPETNPYQPSQNAAASFDCETNEVQATTNLKEKADGSVLVTSITGKDNEKIVLWNNGKGKVSIKNSYTLDTGTLLEEDLAKQRPRSPEGKKIHFVGPKQRIDQLQEQAQQKGHLYCWESINRIYFDIDAKRPVAHYYCANQATGGGYNIHKENPVLGYSYMGSDGKEKINIHPYNNTQSFAQITFPAKPLKLNRIPNHIEVYTNNETGKKFDKPKGISNGLGNTQLPRVMFTPQDEVKTQAQRDQLVAIAKKHGGDVCKASFGFSLPQEQQSNRQQ